MRAIQRLRSFVSKTALALPLLAVALQLPTANAGRPIPYEYPVQLRQANMAMLKFQDALAKERWEDALSHCAKRVKDAARRSPSLREFFRTTLPFDRVLANSRFGYHSESHGPGFDSYGLFFNITPPRSDPHVQWFWKMSAKKDGPWLIDWEPIKFDVEALTKQKEEHNAQRREKVAGARLRLEPKLRGVKTHLQAVSEAFVIGEPMLFQVELINYSKEPLNYTAAGVGYFPLRVFNEEQDKIPCIPGIAQLMQRSGTLKPGATEILAKDVDLSKDYAFAKPGTYYVQYDGASVSIGEWVPTGRVDDPEFVSTSMIFPSNIVKIEVEAKE